MKIMLLSLLLSNSLIAMHLQVNRPIESLAQLFAEDDTQSNLLSEKKLCTICQEHIEPSHAERIFECSHSLHNACCSSGIEIAIDDNSDFACPACRKPVLTNVPFANEDELTALWLTINSDPTRLNTLPEGLLKIRSIQFANLINRSAIPLRLRNEILPTLFCDSINACIVMPRLAAIITQRNSLERKLSIACEKLNVYENENPKLRPLVSRIANQRTHLRKLQRSLEKATAPLQAKIERKKQKLRKESALNGAVVPAHADAIWSNFKLRIGITVTSSILTGICVRNLFASEQTPATKSGIASGLLVASIGSIISCTKFVKNYEHLKRAIEKYQS